MKAPDRAGLAIAAGLAALAALIFFQMQAMPVAALYARIGPTTFPYAVAACLAALAVGTAVSALRGGFPPREADHIGPQLWIVGGLVAQMALLRPAGFTIATAALFACAARAFGRGPIWLSFLIGLVFAFVIYLLFAGLLQLSLPPGPIERMIF